MGNSKKRQYEMGKPTKSCPIIKKFSIYFIKLEEMEVDHLDTETLTSMTSYTESAFDNTNPYTMQVVLVLHSIYYVYLTQQAFLTWAEKLKQYFGPKSRYRC